MARRINGRTLLPWLIAGSPVLAAWLLTGDSPSVPSAGDRRSARTTAALPGDRLAVTPYHLVRHDYGADQAEGADVPTFQLPISPLDEPEPPSENVHPAQQLPAVEIAVLPAPTQPDSQWIANDHSRTPGESPAVQPTEDGPVISPPEFPAPQRIASEVSAPPEVSRHSLWQTEDRSADHAGSPLPPDRSSADRDGQAAVLVPAPPHTADEVSSFPAAESPAVEDSEQMYISDPGEEAERSHDTPAESWSDVPATETTAEVPAPVQQRITELVHHAFSLAERRAYFSAQADLMNGLRLAAQSLDEASRTDTHVQALSRGMRALKEAEDFLPKDTRLDTSRQIKDIVATHRSRILPEADPVSALTALQRYYAYAERQLAYATGRDRAASQAWYGLAKLQPHIESPEGSPSIAGARAMVLHRVALHADKANGMAAHELGVLLARFGHMDEARAILERSAAVQNHPSTWRNLAAVYDRLGDKAQAFAAMQRAGQATPDVMVQEGHVPQRVSVHWLTPKEFGNQAPDIDSPLQPAEQPPTLSDRTLSDRSKVLRPSESISPIAVQPNWRPSRVADRQQKSAAPQQLW